MNVDTILNQLKADVLLSGSWILEEIRRFSSGLLYPDGEEEVSYQTFYATLLSEVENLPHIQLQPVIAPGTSRAYLIDLTTGLETVMDSIEVVHNRVLFFQSKAKSASSAIKNLRDTFKAWYLIALQRELQRFEIKLSNKALEALSDSEFTRLLGDTGSDLEALDQALSLLADRLKARKKLATDKYNLGKDQANASMIPMFGAQQGMVESRMGAEVLKEKYGLGMERPNMVLDDPPENMTIRRPSVATAESLTKRIVSEPVVEHREIVLDDMDELNDEEPEGRPTPDVAGTFEVHGIGEPLKKPEGLDILGVDMSALTEAAFPSRTEPVEDAPAPIQILQPRKRRMLIDDEEEETVPAPAASVPVVDPAPQSTEINKTETTFKKRKIVFED